MTIILRCVLMMESLVTICCRLIHDTLLSPVPNEKIRLGYRHLPLDIRNRVIALNADKPILALAILEYRLRETNISVTWESSRLGSLHKLYQPSWFVWVYRDNSFNGAIRCAIKMKDISNVKDLPDWSTLRSLAPGECCRDKEIALPLYIKGEIKSASNSYDAKRQVFYYVDNDAAQSRTNAS